MFSTFIKQLNDDNEADTWAKAYNNRGHAKYMAVDFDEALHDYELALKTGCAQIENLHKLMILIVIIYTANITIISVRSNTSITLNSYFQSKMRK